MIAETVVGKHDTIFLSEVLFDLFFFQKKALCFSQSAFSNFALYVIVKGYYTLARRYMTFMFKWKENTNYSSFDHYVRNRGFYMVTRGYGFMFKFQEQYLTRSMNSLVRYYLCHKSKKFVSLS